MLFSGILIALASKSREGNKREQLNCLAFKEDLTALVVLIPSEDII